MFVDLFEPDWLGYGVCYLNLVILVWCIVGLVGYVGFGCQLLALCFGLCLDLVLLMHALFMGWCWG